MITNMMREEQYRRQREEEEKIVKNNIDLTMTKKMKTFQVAIYSYREMGYTNGYNGKLIKKAEGINGLNSLMKLYLDEYIFTGEPSIDYFRIQYLIMITDYDPSLLNVNQVINGKMDYWAFHSEEEFNKKMWELLSEDMKELIIKYVKNYTDIYSMDVKKLEKITGIKIRERCCLCFYTENYSQYIKAIKNYVKNTK